MNNNFVITDNQNETLDLVDERDRKIGEIKRKDAHGNNLHIHRSIGVVIFNKKGEILLQKRSMTKDTDPGKWTISCSGHVSSGCTYRQTAIKELEEELGISISLEPVVKFLCQTPKETEIMMLYKGFFEGPFKTHPQEIKEIKFFSVSELKNIIEKKEIDLSFSAEKSLKKLGIIGK